MTVREKGDFSDEHRLPGIISIHFTKYIYMHINKYLHIIYKTKENEAFFENNKFYISYSTSLIPYGMPVSILLFNHYLRIIYLLCNILVKHYLIFWFKINSFPPHQANRCEETMDSIPLLRKAQE